MRCRGAPCHEWCPESNGYLRVKICRMQGSQKRGAGYANYCRKSLQAWRRDLKELVRARLLPP